MKILVATYFDGIGDNSSIAVKLPVAALHLDLVRSPEQLESILRFYSKDGQADNPTPNMILSLGVVDGRNVWKNDYKTSMALIQKAVAVVGADRVMISPSCSLLHVPFDLDFETEIPTDKKVWMAFAKQKLHEISDLYEIMTDGKSSMLEDNQRAIASRRESPVVHNPAVKQRISSIASKDSQRKSTFAVRQQIQREPLSSSQTSQPPRSDPSPKHRTSVNCVQS